MFAGYFISCRYCYLLDDLTPELLDSKCSNYEELQDYLRLRGREAYLQKRVSVFSLWPSNIICVRVCMFVYILSVSALALYS